MDPDPAYDPSLSEEIRRELIAAVAGSELRESGLTALIGRLESEFRQSLSEPGRRERTLAFLHGGPSGPAPPSESSAEGTDPVLHALQETAALSSRLDSVPRASESFSLAVGVARRAHELAGLVEGALSAVDPKEAIGSALHRLAALLSRLIQNAVARLREFAKLLGVSSFSLAFASDPPYVTATFTFGGE